eukprot:TRINITY_DN67838_c9_g1_i1.p1 TRINITY_DN67838_c9_g1~~TRINITY_DN67838_c9_g1_i1.p1  ORF type:complete len:344 (+),score=15.51 TRINITY_DN67838_c9_g1_i1:138-1034(+)
MQDARIKLNVGGTCFETSRSVLTSPKAEDSMLFALGSGWFETAEESNTETFIDRDGPLFGVILDWLRDADKPSVGIGSPAFHTLSLALSVSNAKLGMVPTPDNNLNTDLLAQLEREAIYFGLDQLVTLVQEMLVGQGHCASSTCCLSSGKAQAYERVSPVHLKGTDAGKVRVPLSHVFLPGTSTTLEMRFTNQFTFALYNTGHTVLEEWSTKKLDSECSAATTHNVVIQVDWSQWDIAAQKFLLWTRVTLNGEPWLGNTKMNNWQNLVAGFVVPYFCTYHRDSSIQVTRVSVKCPGPE